jgi:hypothetical protein
MGYKLSITFSKGLKLAQELESLGDTMLQSLLNVMDSYMEQLADRIRTKYLVGEGDTPGKYVAYRQYGDAYKAPTGKLAASVQIIPAHIESDRVRAGVKAAGGDAWYGILHEKGGIQAQYLITPTERPNLVWKGPEGLVARKWAIRLAMPKRPFMQPAKEEMRPEIKEGIKGLLDYLLKK